MDVLVVVIFMFVEFGAGAVGKFLLQRVSAHSKSEISRIGVDEEAGVVFVWLGRTRGGGRDQWGRQEREITST